jgi:hypothetical protein
MKQNIKSAVFITAFLFFGVVLSGIRTGAEESAAAPRAVIAPTTVEFSPVIAGFDVTHVFSIQNKGDAPLNIPGVYSG